MEDKDFKTLLKLAKTDFPKMLPGNGEAFKIEGISQKHSRNSYEVTLALIKDNVTYGVIIGSSLYEHGYVLASSVKLRWFGNLIVDITERYTKLEDLIPKALKNQEINLELETLKIFNDCMALNNGLCSS